MIRKLLMAGLVLALVSFGATSTASAEESSPGPEAVLTGVTAAGVGDHHTCARLSNGQLRCWGLNDWYGQLGDGTTTRRTKPAVVVNSGGSGPLTSMTGVAAGYSHTCGTTTNQRVLCWGHNSKGQLGIGNTTSHLRPTEVRNPANNGPLTGIVQVAVGYLYTCALHTNGQAYCWGENDHGRLGNGGTSDRSLPVQVLNGSGSGPLTGISRIRVGYSHTCALLTNQEVRCWGWNAFGQLGDGTGTDRTRPRTVMNSAGTSRLTGVTALTLGDDHTCVRLANGQARCWGHNQDRKSVV